MLSSQVWGWSEDGVEDKHVEALKPQPLRPAPGAMREGG